MENRNLQKTTTNQPGTLSTTFELSDHQKGIVKVMVNLNDLTAFPMSSSQIIHWAVRVSELLPDVDLGALKCVMDAFATGELNYDKNEGIQNIFRGLRKVEKIGDRYKILKAIY